MPSVQRGQVYKLAGGSWAYRYRDQHKRRRQKGGFGTRSEALEALKGTTSERGYDATHQKLRKIAIARHPYCTDCGTTADLCADHVVPTSRGGRNVLSNYEVRCRTCNNRRMTNET